MAHLPRLYSGDAPDRKVYILHSPSVPVVDRGKASSSYDRNPEVWIEGKTIVHDYLEKPAMQSILPSLVGKDVICFGCGQGEECQILRSLGARRVVGIDRSKALIDRARDLSTDAELHVMDIHTLDFPSSSFDLAYSSLVLHYSKNWIRVFNEVARVLRGGGLFVFSTHHPIYWGALKTETKSSKSRLLGYDFDKRSSKLSLSGDYLTPRKIRDTWFKNFPVAYYHRPLSHIIKDILDSNLELIDCIEPKPIARMRKFDSEFYERSKRIPPFVLFKLRKN